MAVQSVLTPRDRELGRWRYLWFHRFNGFAFTCIGDNVLILYSLKLGMPEYLVGLISSFLYLTMPLMFVGRGLMGHHGAAKVMGWAWTCRHACAALLITAPWMPWPWLSVAVILTAWFGFCMFRSLGMVGFNPLVADITDTYNRGRFSSAIFLSFNGAVLLSMASVVIVTRFSEQVGVFQGIIGTGVLTGLVATWFVMRVPESEAPRNSARRPVLRTMLALWSTIRFRRLVISTACGALAIVLVTPVSMAALKKGYGVGDDVALLFAIVQIMGGLSISLLSGIISDHSGPRPLIIIYGFGMLLVCLLWAVCPDSKNLPYTVAIFAIMGATSMGTLLSFSHYFLIAIKDRDRVSASILSNMAVGLVTGVIGSLLSTGLLRVLQSYGFEGLSLYRGYFGSIAIVILVIIAMHMRLHSLEDWRVSKVLGLMFSPRDLRALLTISRIAPVTSPAQDYRHVDQLATSTSDLSADALVEYLDSPDFSVRGRALVAIGDAVLTDPVREVLMRELSEGEYTTAFLAAQALGDHGVTSAIPALREALHSDDLYLRGKAMVALVQLNDTPSYPQLLEIFSQSENPRILIHGARALADIGNPDIRDLLLHQASLPDLPVTVRHELLYHAARLVHHGDEVYQFLKDYRKDATDAIKNVQAPLGELRSTWPGLPDDIRVCRWLMRDSAGAS